MSCLFPILIKNPKYIPSKKRPDASWADMKDARTQGVTIDCGRCNECRKKKKRLWQMRLTEELKHSAGAGFVTLTFAENWIDVLEVEAGSSANDVAILATRRWRERWRKLYGKSPRHWFITELGHQKTERVHMHGLIFEKPEILRKSLEQTWKYGHVYIGDYVNQKTLNYITKYVTKPDTDHAGFYGRILTSPGIGAKYVSDIMKDYHKKNSDTRYQLPNGAKVPLGTYYKEKIWDEDEREELWIEAMNANEAWIGTQRYDLDNKSEFADYIYAKRQEQDTHIRLNLGTGREMKATYKPRSGERVEDHTGIFYKQNKDIQPNENW